MRHIEIDLETLDTRPSAVVFQVGVVVFDEETGVTLFEKLFDLDILPQILAGRTVDRDTIKWWQSQNPPLTVYVKDSVEVVFDTINKIMGEFGVSYVWSNSPSFDAVIMRSLRESMGIQEEFPSFRSDMDHRTLKNLCKLHKLVEFEARETTHNALQDCRDQVIDLRLMLSTLRDMTDVWKKYQIGELVAPKQE